MKRIYTIEVELDNAAFGEDSQAASHEVRRILEELCGHLQDAGVVHDRNLFDVNGNKVGRARVAKRGK